MKIFKSLVFFFVSAYIITNLFHTYGCANMIPPTGGPKDTLPPVLISAFPRDSAINFTGNRIVFNFNEYVNLENVQQSLIVSPPPKSNPIIDFKLRTVTIKLKDTLKENTTYFFDFGNAIKDVNEGNILRNFSYVFSTGRHIDSLQFSGRVIVAETGKKDTTMIVMLHKNLDDSAVVKDKPRYVARIDSTGSFTFRFLAPGTYNIYALKDEGGSRKYNSKSQLFAFNDKPINVAHINEPLTLYAYAEEGPIAKAPAKTNTSTKKEEKDKRLVIQTNISSNELDILGNLDIIFQTKLKTFDSSKIHFKDGAFNDITAFSLIKDTSLKKITVITKWQPDSSYHLILEKNFAEDSSGRKLLKADTISFRAKKESEYGEVRLRFKNLDLSKNPVLRFSQNDKVKFSFPLTKSEFIKKLFEPGEYDLSILYDDNKNGVWDPGEFFGKHRQPEKVVPIIVPVRNKKKGFNVKASWENDYDFSL